MSLTAWIIQLSISAFTMKQRYWLITCPYRCQHNTAPRYLTAQLQQVSNVGYRQRLRSSSSTKLGATTGSEANRPASLTAVKLAGQCFDNETAAMINYPISASTTPNSNPNPNSNSNPNSRGQRGHNRCVIGVIKCKVAGNEQLVPYWLYSDF